MIDREKVETVLQRRFPEAPLAQIAAATNAIMALDGRDESRTVGRRECGTKAENPARSPQSISA
jgi:hypothetical protein